MKHGVLKLALAGIAASGLLAGCATTVDWGGPLGHYRYHYDSRPIVYSGGSYDRSDRAPTTYEAPAIVDRPVVSFYHHDDDD
ncbi:MAG TPA: hypothetical protein VN858_08110 [Casimicrobiaceae bacterium]|jgi:hypothetical protein|nr:hypothetical protein [Casimicrobiaceae bacterium]